MYVFPSKCESLALGKLLESARADTSLGVPVFTKVVLQAVEGSSVLFVALGLAGLDRVGVALQEIADLGLANCWLTVLALGSGPALLEVPQLRFAHLRSPVHVD